MRANWEMLLPPKPDPETGRKWRDFIISNRKSWFDRRAVENRKTIEDFCPVDFAQTYLINA